MKQRITIEKILEAAVPIFMEKGYLGTSVREIAASLGVKAGSLYYHIRSKEEILEKIHDVLIDELLEKAEEVIANNKISNKKKFELFVKDLLRVMAELRPYATVFFRDYRYVSPYYFAKANKKRKKYQELLLKVIVNGTNKGEFRTTDARITTIGIFGMFMWAHTWIDPNGRLTIEEIAKIFSDVVFDGIHLAQNERIVANKEKKKANTP
jgi:AcrR family transcriptional regulator